MLKKGINSRIVYMIMFGFLTTGLVLSLLSLILSHGNTWTEILFVDKDDSFMDFYNCLWHSHDLNPYIAVDRIYPPICYLFYYILSRFIPIQYLEQGGKAVRSCQEGRTLLVIYTVITTVLLVHMIKSLLQKQKVKELVVCFVLFSPPFLYQFERANIILPTLILLMIFLEWKDEKGLKKNIALLALVIATCFKIYPGIFGILLLKEKRWKDVIICVIGGAIALIIPFFFVGGLEKLFVWVASLTSGMGSTMGMSQGVGCKVNYANIFATLWSLLGNTLTESTFLSGKIFARILTMCLLIASFFQTEKWKVSALLCSIMIGLPDFSFMYVMIFMVIPLVQFINKKTYIRLDIIYAILLSLQFAMILFIRMPVLNSIPGAYKLSFNFLIEGISLIIMSILIFIDTFIMKNKMGEKK